MPWTAPGPRHRAPYRDWARVLGAEYARLQGETARGIPSLISPYAATKPAEFFAVVTELFFEQPVDLRQQLLVFMTRSDSTSVRIRPRAGYSSCAEAAILAETA